MLGKFSYTLSVLIIGIGLGLNFIGKLQPMTVTYILLALYILNSITVKELINKNFQLGKATMENLGLQGQITCLSMQSKMTESLIELMELAKKKNY